MALSITYIYTQSRETSMVQESSGMHHAHKRKRIHVKKEKFPHPDKYKRLMDDAIYFVSLFGLLMTIPQLSLIWIQKNAEGVSVFSWSAYTITAIFWLMYGVMHKEKPIIITNSMWIVLDVLIVLGAVIYG